MLLAVVSVGTAGSEELTEIFLAYLLSERLIAFVE
jgi:hypothetical protein